MTKSHDDDVIAHLLRIERKMDHAITMLNRIARKEATMAKTIKEVDAQVDALIEKVTANTQLDTAIADYVNGLKAANTQLQEELAAAIAANDPEAIQAVSDKLATLNEKMDGDTAASAVMEGTSAANATAARK